MTLIADSGSTKTAWRVIETGQDILTPGINPFQLTEEEICTLLSDHLLPQLASAPSTKAQAMPTAATPSAAPGRELLTDIHFYGAGCTPEKSPIVARALGRTICDKARIHVESDMLGAARGLCGNAPGIVAILGTGSNSCFYDGSSLHQGTPALGFILGDEGSGAYIGKRLVGDVLKHQLPDDVARLFLDETGETQASIIQKVYREPHPNRFLAGLSLFCARHRDLPSLRGMLLDSFRQFFLRNIKCAPWRPLTDDTTVHFVGSIALHYHAELSEAARQCGYSVGNIMQTPIDGLARYHSHG